MGLNVSSLSPTVQAVVVLVVTAVGVRYLRWYLACRSFYNHFKNLPGETDFRWPMGSVHKLHGKKDQELIEYLLALADKYPKFYCFWMGSYTPEIICNHPDTIKAVLKASNSRVGFIKFGKPWLGESLFMAEGERWARSRRLLTPAFHFDILKPYVEVFNRAADVFLGKVENYAQEKKSIDIYGNISLCTLDSILRCAMSYPNDIQTESHPYVQAVNELTDLWVARIRNPLVRNDFIFGLTKSGRRFKKQCDFVHSVSEQVIRERQQSLERDGAPKKRYLDFLDILLTAKDDTGQGLTPLEIRCEVDTFMFAGQDTTASAVSWILYSLCQHPEYQQKVQQEIDTILKGRDSDDIEWADLSKLEYLTMVIKEGLRLHPPVPMMGRSITKPTTVDGVTLPVGTTVSISIFNLHLNHLIWPDRWTFRPDRFHPDNMKDKDSYAFIPFSAGPRNCIGQHFAMNELKVLLCRLLRRYTFTLDPDHPVELKMSATLKPENGMRMFATPRTPAV